MVHGVLMAMKCCANGRFMGASGHEERDQKKNKQVEKELETNNYVYFVIIF